MRTNVPILGFLRYVSASLFAPLLASKVVLRREDDNIIARGPGCGWGIRDGRFSADACEKVKAGNGAGSKARKGEEERGGPSRCSSTPHSKHWRGKNEKDRDRRLAINASDCAGEMLVGSIWDRRGLEWGVGARARATFWAKLDISLRKTLRCKNLTNAGKEKTLRPLCSIQRLA